MLRFLIPKRHWLLGTTFEFDPPNNEDDNDNNHENKTNSKDRGNADGGLSWSKCPNFA
jgi:hypothetical protein